MWRRALRRRCRSAAADMGIVSRLALVLRSCLSATSDRLDRIASEEREREAESLRRAMEELKATQAAGAPGHRVSESVASASVRPEVARLSADYRLLGIAPGADLSVVEAAWRNLATRADPKRFPAGSEEEKRAAELLKSINEAYARIREALNPTEGRFGQLEL